MEKVLDYDFERSIWSKVLPVAGGAGSGAGGYYLSEGNPIVALISGGAGAVAGYVGGRAYENGKVFDRSEYGNGGMLRNGAEVEDGVLVLDGEDDYVEVIDETSLGLDTTTEFRITARVKSSEISGDEMVILHNGRDILRFVIWDGDTVSIVYYSASADDWKAAGVDTVKIDDGLEHEVSWSVKEGKLTAIVDGENQGTADLAYDMPNVDGDVSIGKGQGSSEYFGPAFINSVRIFK